jgi:hypothetical protein
MRPIRPPKAPQPGRRTRFPLRVHVALLAFSAIGLAVVVPGLVPAPAASAPSESNLVESGDSQDAPLSIAVSNATFCGLITPYAGALPEPATTDFYARLCVQSEFQSIVVAWGGLYVSSPSNGSPAVYGAANFTPVLTEDHGWVDIEFSVNWVSSSNCTRFGPSCAHTATWTGNESTGVLSGPQLDTYPLACSCGPALAELGPNEWILTVVLIAVVLGVVAVAVLVLALGRGRRPPQSTRTVGAAAASGGPPSATQSASSPESDPRRGSTPRG